ncbi:uncharacterized protein N7484_007961 [Penicillium longicatenatum]|uniref:uncharacterized protein n=1 Tax=Penicillium longicatenatum TaxID=1561947 RepID=UPI0025467614|nr:uncharacterized protein N7484_007961 [Penicillium longicatenatum]KAJ5640099.1 hypothetical protein N7484_007961 [Penicillium longicatenatum]
MIPPSDDPDEFSLSIFVCDFSSPDRLFEEIIVDIGDQPVDNLMHLYTVDIDLSAEGSGGGIIYHQRSHRVAIFMHLDAYY